MSRLPTSLGRFACAASLPLTIGIRLDADSGYHGFTLSPTGTTAESCYITMATTKATIKIAHVAMPRNHGLLDDISCLQIQRPCRMTSTDYLRNTPCLVQLQGWRIPRLNPRTYWPSPVYSAGAPGGTPLLFLHVAGQLSFSFSMPWMRTTSRILSLACCMHSFIILIRTSRYSGVPRSCKIS